MTKKERDKKIQNQYKLNGVLPSPPDVRDYTPETVNLAAVALPEEYELPYKTPILNQGAYGSCVAHALSTAMRYGEALGQLQKHDFSRGFIYGNRLSNHYQGEGMIIREALYQLNHDGDCLYIDFPFNNTYPWCKNQISKNEKNLKEKAKPYIIVNYFRLTKDTDIKQALKTCGAVVCSVPVYSGFGAETPLPQPNEHLEGYHAVCLVGWDKKGWILQNSWGVLWGKRGFFHIPYNYPVAEWWGLTVNGSPATKSNVIKILIKLSNLLKTVKKKICK